MKSIAIIGGGIAGVSAAYELAKLDRENGPIEFEIFEASDRLGGIVETYREGDFVIEGGPDGWVSEKPWARELAIELGLEKELVFSQDEGRKTYVLIDGKLQVIPDGMRMMVPTDLSKLEGSPLFSPTARAAYAAEIECAKELKVYAAEHQDEDESISSFVQRHFGEEVLTRLAAPLLAGVFGGDVAKLSVRSVMAPFKAMELEHGSLILALQAREKKSKPLPVFTSLRAGLGTLIDHMVEAIPQGLIHLSEPVTTLTRQHANWLIRTSEREAEFDNIVLATPAHVTADLLSTTDPALGSLLPVDASSAIIVALAFEEAFPLPPGFGFLVPPGTSESRLLAATFVDQKFPHRTPSGHRLLRVFFSDAALGEMTDAVLVRLALGELTAILGPLPEPAIQLVRRWPRSLPQYEVGHQARMAQLQQHVAALPGLQLIGNAYNGVGLPDLIREGRAAAHTAAK